MFSSDKKLSKCVSDLKKFGKGQLWEERNTSQWRQEGVAETVEIIGNDTDQNYQVH